MLKNLSRSPGRHLADVAAVVYHVAMELLRNGKKEVVKFVTPSGVTGIVSTSISDTALRSFARSLEAKIARTQARLAREAAKSTR